MSTLLEMIGRGWANFLARPNGSLSLRFYIQPTMASLLALRAGIEDRDRAGKAICGRYSRARRGVCSCSTRAGGEQ